jgi:ATP-binding protein involved in chromosome partitioning
MIFGRKGQSEQSALEQQVWDALKKVQDPELHKSLVEIGMIKNLTVKDGVVSFDILLTTTACPLKAQIQNEAKQAVEAVEGVKEVKANISGETLAPKVPKKNPIPIPFPVSKTSSPFPAERAAWAKAPCP